MFSADVMRFGSGGSAIREIAAQAQARARRLGEDQVFDFSIGSPSVPPPPCVHRTIRELLDNEDPVLLHGYTPAPGLFSVRQAISRDLSDRFGLTYRPEDLYLTHGASAALAMGVNALLSPGEEALTMIPYFSEYRVYVEGAGARLTEVPAAPDTFRPDLDALARAVGPETRLLILNTPNNPSGVVLSKEELEGIAALLREKSEEFGHAIYVLSDEPYRDLVYDGEAPAFFPELYPNTLFCYSFSKTLSLPGERIGYLALTPGMEDRDRVYTALCGAARMLGYVCVSPLMQRVVERCLKETADISVYRKNRDLLCGFLTELGYEFLPADGAFYLFLRSPEPDDRAFCRRAMDLGIAMVPGAEFGAPGYARISYCVPARRIQNAVPAFRDLLQSYHDE